MAQCIWSWWKMIFFFFMCILFLQFHHSNAQITQFNSHCWWSFPFQGSRCKLYLAHPKNWYHDFASWLLHFWTFQMAFTSCTPLSWLLIWLQSEIVDPRFVHYHKPTQEIIVIPSKQCQTSPYIVYSLLLLFHCDQMRHTFERLFSCTIFHVKS